jgi:putative transposase
MKGKRLSDEQISRILPEAVTLDHVREVCRQHHMAAQTWYRWRRQFGGLEVSEAQRLRMVERAHAALTRLVGALPRDHRRLQEVLGKNWSAWLPSARRRLWSRRIPSGSDAPAASWRATAGRNGGRPASRSRVRGGRVSRALGAVAALWGPPEGPSCASRTLAWQARARPPAAAAGGTARYPAGAAPAPRGPEHAPPTQAAPPHQVWSSAGVHDETPAGRRRRRLTVRDADTREGLPRDWARSRTSGAVGQVLPR